MTMRPAPLLFKVLVLGLLLAIALLPGTGGAARKSAKLTTVHFRTGFGVGAWDGGFYVAKAKGFYSQAGINAVIDQGQGSFSNVQLVASGKADIVNAASPAVIQFASQGAPIKMIASYVQSAGSGIPNRRRATVGSASRTAWGTGLPVTT